MKYIIINNKIINCDNLETILEMNYKSVNNIFYFKNFIILINYKSVIIYNNFKFIFEFNFNEVINSCLIYKKFVYLGTNIGKIYKLNLITLKINKILNFKDSISIEEILEHKNYLYIKNSNGIIKTDLFLNIINELKYNDIISCKIKDNYIILSNINGRVKITNLKMNIIKNITYANIIINVDLFDNILYLHSINRYIISYSLINNIFLKIINLKDMYLINTKYNIIFTENNQIIINYNSKLLYKFFLNFTSIFQIYLKNDLLFIEYFFNINTFIYILNLKTFSSNKYKFKCNGYKINISKLVWNNNINKYYPLKIQININYLKKYITNNIVFNNIVKYL